MRASIATLLLLGCAGGSTDSANWWEIPADNTTLDTPEFDEDDEEGDEKYVWGELILDGGEITDGLVGVFWADADEPRCDMDVPIAASEPVEGCSSCQMAWELRLGAPEIIADDGGCAEFEDLFSAPLRIGVGGEALYLDDGSWIEVGEVFEGDEPDTYYFEIWLDED